MWRCLAILPALIMLAACNRGVGDGTVDVAYIGDGEDIFAEGVRIGPGAQLVRSARWEGLVRLDAQGAVVPALAERWIVTDDGLSYIFRIRELDRANGDRLTARAVRRALRQGISDLKGTSLGLDLGKISEVRAITGRVVEIRLKSPMPGLLQLLAQPELVIAADDLPNGLMAMQRTGDTALFTPLPPQQRGLPEQGDWEDSIRPVTLRRTTAEEAVTGFANDRYDVIMGGRVQDLPLAASGPLSRGTVRLDGAIGLFGLDIRRPAGFLASPENREALAMALDRAALIEPLGVGGWQASTRIVPAGLPALANTPRAPRWNDQPPATLRDIAASRVARWKNANGTEVQLVVALPEGPGAITLFAALAGQFSQVGVSLVRAAPRQPADLVLRDRTARFDGARWFLNQFNCTIEPRLCSDEADALVALASTARDPGEQAQLLAQAEEVLMAANLYIPIGAPIRWSQVRSDVPGFAENPWAFHPLFPLSGAPM